MEDEDIRTLARRGEMSDAIRLYRKRYGVGLAEAKAAVEAMMLDRSGAPQGDAAIEEVLQALRTQGHIQAIKLYRQRFSVGLREAKDAVDALVVQHQVKVADPDSNCFVATAAWGDTEAPEVVVLRRWRDEVLRPSRPGRAFIAAYYRLSPPLARWVAADPRRRRWVRCALASLVDRWVV